MFGFIAKKQNKLAEMKKQLIFLFINCSYHFERVFLISLYFRLSFSLYNNYYENSCQKCLISSNVVFLILLDVKDQILK